MKLLKTLNLTNPQMGQNVLLYFHCLCFGHVGHVHQFNRSGQCLRGNIFAEILYRCIDQIMPLNFHGNLIGYLKAAVLPRFWMRLTNSRAIPRPSVPG